eukprot:scaffold338_cov377-Prasinococcus_capsulatus_cf.AAC.19
MAKLGLQSGGRGSRGSERRAPAAMRALPLLLLVIVPPWLSFAGIEGHNAATRHADNLRDAETAVVFVAMQSLAQGTLALNAVASIQQSGLYGPTYVLTDHPGCFKDVSDPVLYAVVAAISP